MRIVGTICILLLCASSAFADGFSGWGRIDYTTSEDRTDGEVMKESDVLTRSGYLRFEKPVTPMLKYRLEARAVFSDTDLSTERGESSTYVRILEPSADIFFSNPLYFLNLGYRYRESLNAPDPGSDLESTQDYYYSRFTMKPYELPRFSLLLEKKENSNKLPTSSMESTNKIFSVSSSYDYRYRGLRAFYDVSFTRKDDETPGNQIEETTDDLWSARYGFDYDYSYMDGSGSAFASYQANWYNSQREIHTGASAAGSFLNRRAALDGLYALGTVLQPDVEVLSSNAALIDGDLDTGIPSINISVQQYHNIGIFVVSGTEVDRLYIYVNRNISTDTGLGVPAGWEVYMSDANVSGTVWAPVPLSSVAVTPVDVLNEIYRYELIFSSPQATTYFKAVTMDTVNAIGVTNVEVTEIEAWGTDPLPPSGIARDTTEVYRQEIYLQGSVQLDTLRLLGSYSLSKADTNASYGEATGNLFENIFNRAGMDEESVSTTEVIRYYVAGMTWLTHRMLTTDLRLTRRETYDNRGKKDDVTNDYNLTFRSVLLPTLNANLSFLYSDHYRLRKHDRTDLQTLLSIGTKLFPGVDMVTDLGFRTVDNFTSDVKTDSYYINGNLNAALTRRLSGKVIYGVDWITQDGRSLTSDSWNLYLTYRPGKRISFSGTVRTASSEGSHTTTELIGIDWLPFKVIRLNANYQHSESYPGSEVEDRNNAAITWYMNRYFTFNTYVNYSRRKLDTKEEVYSLNMNLNARF